MATTPPYSDDFTGTGSLGGATIEVGGVVWQQFNGTAWTRSNGHATTSTSVTSNPILAIDVGWPNVDLSASCSSSGGDALYFRVVDGNNWLRLRLKSTSVATGTTYSAGPWTTTGTTCNLGGPQFTTVTTSTDPASGLATGQVIYGGAGECSVGTNTNGTPATSQTRTITATTTFSTTFSVVLDKCVAGTITQLGTASVTSSTTSLRLTANGSSIVGYANGVQVGTWIDTTNASATIHGIGRGGPTSSNASALDNFALTPLNRPPNAPTLTFPVGGITIDGTITERFLEGFSDPDPGDSQSKANLYYRVVGTSTWTEVTITGPNGFYDFPAGTFSPADYEWQAETYDAAGNLGARSASAFFTVATPPAGPVYTSPVNGATIGNASQIFDWSVTAQDAYQIRSVADDGSGSPDTSTVYQDSGEVDEAATRTASLPFLVNDRTEHVQLRVKSSGLWSAWTDSTHPVSYTAPAAPIVGVEALQTVISANDSTDSLQVAVTQPTPSGGEPAVTYVDIWRRILDSTGAVIAGSEIRIATGQVASVTFIDYTPASGVTYQYQAVSFAANGTSAASDWEPGNLGAFTALYDTAIYGTSVYG